MGKQEHLIENQLRDAIGEIGGITRKWVSPGRSGVPDQIVIYKGHIFFIEVKTMSGYFRPRQLREMEELMRHGAKVFTINSKVQISNLIKHIQKEFG